MLAFPTALGVLYWARKALSLDAICVLYRRGYTGTSCIKLCHGIQDRAMFSMADISSARRQDLHTTPKTRAITLPMTSPSIRKEPDSNSPPQCPLENVGVLEEGWPDASKYQYSPFALGLVAYCMLHVRTWPGRFFVHGNTGHHRRRKPGVSAPSW